MSKNMESLNEICSTREASEALGVSQRTVQLWVESGVLNAWKSPGGHRKITIASVNKILQGRVKSIQADTSNNNEDFVILYVEDDLAQQALFSNFLSRLKSKVKLQSASNGFEGLILLGKNKPDLLISDLKMLGMDGFEMIKHLQKNKEFSNIKIIVFTSMSDQEIFEHGGLTANIQVITKPVPLNSIGLLIDSLVLAKSA